MEKKLRFTHGILFVIALCLLFSCDILFPELSKGEKLLEYEIGPSDTTVVVTIAGRIIVEIPPGAIDEKTVVRIYKPKENDVQEDESRQFHDVYNVEISGTKVFDIPLKITLYYDPSLVEENDLPDKIGAASYNEEWQQWSSYDSVCVDTVLHAVTFETGHLTKLSAWTLHGYTDWTSNRHFNIYWCSSGTNAPVADADYRARDNSDNPDDPLYIQDMSDYLDQAYDALKAKGLKLPSSKINVWVTDLGGDDGQSTARGSIYISNRCSGGTISRPARQALPSACAHELLHIVQDYYYVWTTAMFTTKWWLEATATQADRMVWADLGSYEAIDYADDAMHRQMHLPWDQCQSDPEWYIAGGFLTYLSQYRNGKKADIAKLLIKGGETSISYFRTIIDTYIKEELDGSGIGKDFGDYIKWAYESNGPITIPYINPSSLNRYPAEHNYLLTFNKNTATFKETLSRLSARIVRIMINEDTDLPSILTINPVGLDDGITAYLYVDHVYDQEIRKNEKAYCSLIKSPVSSNQKRYANILIINESKDAALQAEIKLSVGAQETRELSFSQKIYGRALGEHGNNLMVSCNATVSGYKPVEILSIEQDATDLGEYITCRLIVHLSSGAFLGKWENLSLEFHEPGKLIVDKSASEGWKWEWQEFLGGNAEIVNMTSGDYVYPTIGGGNTFTLSPASGQVYQAGFTEVTFQAKTVKSVFGGDNQWHDQEVIYILKVLFQPPE
jgi:hypothetical protein